MVEMTKPLSANLNFRSDKLADAALSSVPKAMNFLQPKPPSLKTGIKAASQLTNFYAPKKQA
jgi:hypothetical protein